MNTFQKILGAIFPPYKFSLLRQEQSRLFYAIIDALPDSYNEIKTQAKSGTLFSLDTWTLFPEFKFTTIGYRGGTITKFKKRGQDFKISGLRIFSKLNNRFEEIAILVQNNLVTGLRISNSEYQLSEFDLSKIINSSIVKTDFTFPPNEIDKFYNKLDSDIKDNLNSEDIFDIDLNGKTYYAFYDLEDGNYLAVDNSLTVYSLTHDEEPNATKLKTTFKDILADIAKDKFDISIHLDNKNISR